MGSSSGNSGSIRVRIEILRLLLQEEREHPDSLEIEKIQSRIGPDYGHETISNTLSAMDCNPASPLEYWDNDQDEVCLQDLDLAASRVQEFLDNESDPFP